ncbi:MAG: nuclear transport factor 2 family protein [Gammaproteobacteria bacterium]|nr:nuclear transport factor 2 family protein [Gammaproteobacteria bacterium]
MDNASHYYGWCPDQHSQACKQRLLLEACRATANSYPYLRDRLLYDQYGALFTEEAVFQIEGSPELVGRQAITAALRERGSQGIMRHVSHVVNIAATGEASAEAVSYVTIWREETTPTDKAVSGPWIMGEYHDEFQMQNRQCLISKRVVKIVFLVAGSVAP